MKQTNLDQPKMIIVDFDVADIQNPLDQLTIVHNLNTLCPLVQCYYKGTNGADGTAVEGQQFNPDSIICSDPNTIVMDVHTADPDSGGWVVIMGGNFPRFVSKGNSSLG